MSRAEKQYLSVLSYEAFYFNGVFTELFVKDQVCCTFHFDKYNAIWSNSWLQERQLILYSDANVVRMKAPFASVQFIILYIEFVNCLTNTHIGPYITSDIICSSRPKTIHHLELALATTSALLLAIPAIIL